MSAFPYFEIRSNASAPCLHFAHANGYPPQAYAPFLEALAAKFHVTAMEARPLWPGTNPREVKDWGKFVEDMLPFLQAFSAPVIGVGHSLGGTVTLMAAIQRPELFRAVVLIDPPFYPPFFSLLWRVFFVTGLVYYVHPLVRGALKRRTLFENQEAMFRHYRAKKVFENINDQGLWAYVNSLATPWPQGGVTLRYPSPWEVRVYVTSMLRDWQTWRELRGFRLPILLLRPELSPATPDKTVRLLQRVAPQTVVRTIPNTTHLAPFESPTLVAEMLLEFLK
ncbi:MAG: alpha/beta hydrolase [Anaerolineales bacterium]